MNSTDVARAASEAGQSLRTMQWASQAVGIRRKKQGMNGGWYWELPPKIATLTSWHPSLKLAFFGGQERQELSYNENKYAFRFALYFNFGHGISPATSSVFRIAYPRRNSEKLPRSGNV